MHPELRGGRGRPDFAITGSSGGTAYVEADVGGLTGFMAKDSLEDEVLDAIDALAVERPTRIRLSARTRGKLIQPPPIRSTKETVRRWLDRIDGESSSSGRIEAEPSLRISYGEWSITLTAIYRRHHVSNKLIYLGPGKSGPSSESVALRKNVVSKAKQHRDLERPLIIAMNTHSGFQGREDELKEFLGGHSEAELVASLQRRNTGAFEFGPVVAVPEQHSIKVGVEAPFRFISPAHSGLGVSVSLPEWTASCTDHRGVRHG